MHNSQYLKVNSSLEKFRVRRTSSIFVAEVREPPTVAKADGVADGGEDEFDVRVPGFAFRYVIGPFGEVGSFSRWICHFGVDDVLLFVIAVAVLMLLDRFRHFGRITCGTWMAKSIKDGSKQKRMPRKGARGNKNKTS